MDPCQKNPFQWSRLSRSREFEGAEQGFVEQWALVMTLRIVVRCSDNVFDVNIFVLRHIMTLDGLAIRNANRSDSRESIPRGSIRNQTHIFIKSERFARIAKN